MGDRTVRVISVEINGQRYPVRSALDENYVIQLAAYVDAKMRTAAQEAPTGDTHRIAVLAALNIADEFFRRDEFDDGSAREELRRRTAGIERLVDDALQLAEEAGARPEPSRPGE